MPDQANDLRNLVLRAARSSPAASTPPKLVVLAGGKGGVGTTTIAVNLAISLARDGRRVVLVDADLDGADAGMLCRLDEPSSTVADILSGRLSVHEALERGPAGIQVLPGAWPGNGLVDCSPSAQQRLLAQLKCLGAHADFVILDVGSGANRVIGHFWQSADHVFLVTTPDVVSVMDAYAAVKVLCAGVAPPSLKSVVNFSPSAAAAADVHQRLSRACRRFLGLKLTAGGHIPCDARVSQAAAERQPFMLEHPTCEAAQAVEQLAQWLCQPAAKASGAAKPAPGPASASARRASA
jgi:flagellar biosynthesis protein FlhG